MMISTWACYAIDDVLFSEGSLFRIVSSLNPIKISIFNGLPFSLSVRLRLTVMKWSVDSRPTIPTRRIRKADSTLQKACVSADPLLLSLEPTVDGYSGVVHSKWSFWLSFFVFKLITNVFSKRKRPRKRSYAVFGSIRILFITVLVWLAVLNQWNWGRYSESWTWFRSLL